MPVFDSLDSSNSWTLPSPRTTQFAEEEHALPVIVLVVALSARMTRIC